MVFTTNMGAIVNNLLIVGQPIFIKIGSGICGIRWIEVQLNFYRISQQVTIGIRQGRIGVIALDFIIVAE